MLLGKCNSQTECNSRHVLTKRDISQKHVPRQGSIKMEILHINSPRNFVVRLLEHKSTNSTNWSVINNSNEYKNFRIKFLAYYFNLNKREIHYPINVGDFCVVAHENSFYRCTIVKREDFK